MSLVESEDRGPVRHVILNRPEKRNAFDGELSRALGAALAAAADEPSVRVVVVRANGPMFSSGMDFNALSTLGQKPETGHAFRRDALTAFNLAEEMPKPTIAQIHGGCIGGAMELAIACDLRVMAADAVMGLVETRVGLVPDVGGCSRLPALIGVGRAKEMILTSKVVGAEEAERIGLVNRVAAPDELDTATEALANELLACSPTAIRLAKRVVDAAAKPALAATLEHEIVAQQLCFASEDFVEGARAMVERRAPQFG